MVSCPCPSEILCMFLFSLVNPKESPIASTSYPIKIRFLQLILGCSNILNTELQSEVTGNGGVELIMIYILCYEFSYILPEDVVSMHSLECTFVTQLCAKFKDRNFWQHSVRDI